MIKDLDAEASGAINRYRAVAGEIESLAVKYSSPPPPIDFAAYRAKLSDASVVDAFEADSKALTFPKFEGALKEEFETKAGEIVASAASAVEESKLAIAELEEQLKAMEHIRSGNPTISDVYAAYPEIQKEVDEEIETHQWCKDTF